MFITNYSNNITLFILAKRYMSGLNFNKSKNQAARPNTIRDINRQIVLNYVREHREISRAKISKLTELQRSTVSIIVDDLIGEGFLEEIGSGESTGGRKPTMLQLQKGKAAVIGIDITPTYTNIASADLAGNHLQTESFLTSPDMDETFAKIIAGLKKITDKVENPNLEIGISIPGLVDERQENVIHVPYFRWENWKLSEDLFHETNLRAIVENDANSIALAELWIGNQDIHNLKNFITILVAEGIGTGIAVDGKVYRGESGIAGEFGHMIIGVESDIECSCGSKKCWEAFASDCSTIARFKRLSKEKELREMQDIMNLFQQGDPIAIKAIKESLKYLSIGISNLLVGLNPQAVIVSGIITKSWHLIAEDISLIAKRNVRRELPKTILMASRLGDNPTLTGALSLVLARKFGSII
jgi:predicted NBD/HSP70 family sugar kinase